MQSADRSLERLHPRLLAPHCGCLTPAYQPRAKGGAVGAASEASPLAATVTPESVGCIR